MKRPIPDLPFQCIKNPRSDRPSQYGPELQRLLSLEAHKTAFDIIGAWPGYEKTPLQTLNGVAKAMGVESLHYKDEGFRFGLKSFKALGGAYALCLFLLGEVKRRTGADKVTPDDLAQGKYKEILSNITFTATTDGNHGRSVAWGALTFGCNCVIYIPTNVSQGREDAIASYGAEIVRVGATFDESLKHCIADAEKFDRFNISDTAYPGNMDVPRDVMQGYTVMSAEVLEQIAEPPTHVFIQGGCGGLASSVVGHLWETLSDKRPCFTLVEPNAAACGFESIKAGKPVVPRRGPGNDHGRSGRRRAVAACLAHPFRGVRLLHLHPGRCRRRDHAPPGGNTVRRRSCCRGGIRRCRAWRASSFPLRMKRFVRRSVLTKSPACSSTVPKAIRIRRCI